MTLIQIFAGLTFTGVCLAPAVYFFWRQKAPRSSVFFSGLAGFGTVGTFFESLITGLATRLPGAVVGFAGVLCVIICFGDCWGRRNHAGRPTAVVALITPLLLVVMPVSVFGVDPDQLVRDVKQVGQQTLIAGGQR
ncbi:hypothetical protein [Nonomuraea basaltis]|uniref:hypothetical protein n=1 Tax=Nonomuraea basaltis TaxID=2495887 RepID=UPI00110C5537|nr:hypothetical protein [Nonomuraea basaltis]TMR97509.1 hypothetical protein EJK15_17460 [Nonomuraea basaltis]